MEGEIDIRKGRERQQRAANMLPELDHYVSEAAWKSSSKEICQELSSNNVSIRSVHLLSLLHGIDSNRLEFDLGQFLNEHFQYIHSALLNTIDESSERFREFAFDYARCYALIKGEEFRALYGFPSQSQISEDAARLWHSVRMHVLKVSQISNPCTYFQRAAECLSFNDKEWVNALLVGGRASQLPEWLAAERVTDIVSFLKNAAALILLDDPLLNNLSIPPVTLKEFKSGLDYLRKGNIDCGRALSVGVALKVISEASRRTLAEPQVKRQPLPIMRI